MPDIASPQTAAVLDVLAEMRALASCLEQRTKYDELAAAVISTDIGRPLVMADNLAHYMKLSGPSLIPLHAKALLARLMPVEAAA
jgi:hypothetical protein